MPAVNARMYAVNAPVKAHWHRVFSAALAHANLDWQFIEHDAPRPLSELWARDDLGLALMCGLPYALREPMPLLVAAPVPALARYEGRAVYFTDIVVRADAPFRELADTFGGVVGYTLADSLSGGVAFAKHLEPYRTPQRRRLYRKSVGGLVHARGVIEALVSGRIDVGPLDSYYHDLLRHNEPAMAQQVRVLESTQARPIPPLVSTLPLDDYTLHRLREGLHAAVCDISLRDSLDHLLLDSFAVPDAAAYDPLAALGPSSSTPSTTSTFWESCS